MNDERKWGEVLRCTLVRDAFSSGKIRAADNVVE